MFIIWFLSSHLNKVFIFLQSNKSRTIHGYTNDDFCIIQYRRKPVHSFGTSIGFWTSVSLHFPPFLDAYAFVQTFRLSVLIKGTAFSVVNIWSQLALSNNWSQTLSGAFMVRRFSSVDSAASDSTHSAQIHRFRFFNCWLLSLAFLQWTSNYFSSLLADIMTSILKEGNNLKFRSISPPSFAIFRYKRIWSHFFM